MKSRSERQVIVNRTDVKPEPSDTARIKIEILFGERVRLLEEGKEWSRAATIIGDYEGFVRTEHLGETYDPTHRVSDRMAVMYNEPHFKNASPGEPLYFNSLVAVEESQETPEGTMYKLKGTGWVFETQLSPIEYRAPDFLEECLKFLGTQYGYEKRGALIDCSTLVQAGCIAAGISCPYDVKGGEMEKLGEAVELAPDVSNLQRGDLVFWTESKIEGRTASHVVIMIDGTNCLHATIEEPHRKTLIQPLADVIAHQEHFHGGSITSVRRFPGYRSV